jgi:hypothetical protein
MIEENTATYDARAHQTRIIAMAARAIDGPPKLLGDCAYPLLAARATRAATEPSYKALQLHVACNAVPSKIL